MTEPSLRLSWSDFVFELAELARALPQAPSLYLVGGALRDAGLRRAIDDIDLAVDGDAIAIARFFADALAADIYVMDRERDVARVLIKRDDANVTIDFARLRGASLDDDLGDRDFTINAMAADLRGDISVVYDPLNGAADLRQKILRRCSPRSIADDPIRALRAVRLSLQFDLKIHPKTAADVKRGAKDLRQSSPERIRDELFKLLRLEQASRGLRVMSHLGLLPAVMPILAESESGAPDPGTLQSRSYALAVVEKMSALLTAISSRRTDNTAAEFSLGMLVIQLDRFRSKLQAHLARVYGNGREHGQLLVLAAAILALDGGARKTHRDAASQAALVAKSLALTRAEQRRLPLIVVNYRQVVEEDSWSALDQHRFWHRLGDGGIDGILLAAASVLGERGRGLQQGDWLRFVDHVTVLLDVYFNRYEEVVAPAPLLDGRDVQDLLGIGPGPLVGRVLTDLREAQAVGEVSSIVEARDFVLRWTAPPF